MGGARMRGDVRMSIRLAAKKCCLRALDLLGCQFAASLLQPSSSILQPVRCRPPKAYQTHDRINHLSLQVQLSRGGGGGGEDAEYTAGWPVPSSRDPCELD